jgi:predicted trehalose synthase
LQDVAGMIRSFHYAAYAALLKQIERGTPVNGQLEQMISWARFWARWVGAIFYKAYLKAASGATFFPPTESDLQMMTEIFLLRKSIYELGDMLNNRPDWVKIPLQGILDIMSEPTVAATAAKESTGKETK